MFNKIPLGDNVMFFEQKKKFSEQELNIMTMLQNGVVVDTALPSALGFTSLGFRMSYHHGLISYHTADTCLPDRRTPHGNWDIGKFPF